MRIELRNDQRHPLFAVHVNLDDPPAVVRPADADGPTVHLDWDRALDDEHHLRHCPACGCPDLFARKRMPQLTGFVLILLAALVAMVLFGIGEVILALLVLVFVLAVDVGIYFFTRHVLVCYRCHTQFSGMPIERAHVGFDNATADRHRPAEQPPADADACAPGASEAEHRPQETASR